MKCLIHKWDGCKCSRCGKVRDEQHDWNGCQCRRCGTIRAEQHDWDLCKGKCKRCGASQPKQHDWVGCQCRCCGTIRDEQHDWVGCKCARCGKVQSIGHNYVAVSGECAEKCSICGQEREAPHSYVVVPGKCEEECANCGNTRQTHEYVKGKCIRCGCVDQNTVMDQYLTQLLAIFPRTQLSPSGHVAFNEKHEAEVRAIGKQLDRLGGMRCMRAVGEAFARELPIHARKLETMWDGIGGWMG